VSPATSPSHASHTSYIPHHHLPPPPPTATSHHHLPPPPPTTTSHTSKARVCLRGCGLGRDALCILCLLQDKKPKPGPTKQPPSWSRRAFQKFWEGTSSPKAHLHRKSASHAPHYAHHHLPYLPQLPQLPQLPLAREGAVRVGGESFRRGGAAGGGGEIRRRGGPVREGGEVVQLEYS
jgi:hypothetical protein